MFLNTLNLTAAQDIISRIQYKDWFITINPASPTNPTATIFVESGHIPDTYFPNRKVTLRTVHNADLRDEDSLVWSVFEAIKNAELHEMSEWFKYNGVIVNNPHGSQIRPSETVKPKARVEYGAKIPDFVQYIGQPIKFLGDNYAI